MAAHPTSCYDQTFVIQTSVDIKCLRGQFQVALERGVMWKYRYLHSASDLLVPRTVAQAGHDCMAMLHVLVSNSNTQVNTLTQ
jgi:hypothetical protein